MEIMTATVKFETGNIYQMRFIGDSDLKPSFICIARTDKMATFERLNKTEQVKRKIKIDGSGVEYIVDGSYSMAPSISSDKVIG